MEFSENNACVTLKASALENIGKIDYNMDILIMMQRIGRVKWMRFNREETVAEKFLK